MMRVSVPVPPEQRQPMDTAPKDRAIFLGDDTHIAVAHWSGEGWALGDLGNLDVQALGFEPGWWVEA